MYYNGLYHLFYQYSPREPIWENIVWGHSVSKDLVNWEALEHAIYPSEWFDTNGCWSGSATTLLDNKPVILYTGIDTENRQVQVYAMPKDLSDLYLREWIKPKDINPVIIPDVSMNANAFRDPTTGWYANGHWNILVGSELKDGGVVYLYRSKDFKKWIKAEHPFHSKMETGMWECPDFFPVLSSGQTGLDSSDDSKNVKYVLKVSLDLARYDYYTVGSYDRENDRYYPNDNSVDGWDGLRLDYGNFYASRTFYDPIKKRRIVWAWVTESALDQQQRFREKGWAGIQIFPRKVWLDESGKQLVQWPIEEVEGLRRQNVQLANYQINKGEHVEIIGITTAQADVDVIFSFQSLDNVELFDPKWENLAAQEVCAAKGSKAQGGIGPFGLLTLASQNLEEFTPVFFIVFKASSNYKVLLCSDARSSSLASGLKKPSFAGFVDIDLADKEISLRSLIDHSVVESFGAGGKIVVTSRVYPTIAVYDKTHLFVFNNGSETITIENLNAWSLESPVMNRPVKD